MEDNTPWVPLEEEVSRVGAHQEATARVPHIVEVLQSTPQRREVNKAQANNAAQAMTYATI